MAGHKTESKAGMRKNSESAKILCCLHCGLDPLSLAFSLGDLGDLDSWIFLGYGQPRHLINRTAYSKFDLFRAPEKQNHWQKKMDVSSVSDKYNTGYINQIFVVVVVVIVPTDSNYLCCTVLANLFIYIYINIKMENAQWVAPADNSVTLLQSFE